MADIIANQRAFGSAAYANDKAYYQQLAGQTPPGDGQVKFDREHGMFGVTIARTAGFFAESGKHECGPLAARLKTILKSWGRLPHLMRAGKSEIVLALQGEAYRVHALAADGSRRAEIPVEFSAGSLKFTADTTRDFSEATYLYEIVRQDR